MVIRQGTRSPGAVRWQAESVTTPDRVLPARVYLPEAETLGWIVWAHGGSWRGGTLDGWHQACARLARASAWAVVSIAYRLAPLHPHPEPVRDVLAALDWAGQRAVGPHGPLPLAVGGDSAGGTIAACAALARRDLGRPLAAQVLAYPPLDPACAAPSYRSGDFPDPRILRAAWDEHRGRGGTARALGTTLYSTPLEAPTLAGLAPALLAVGEYDPVVDDVRDYARRLREAGNYVELHELPLLRHGAFVSTEALGDRLGAALHRRSQ